VNLIVAANDPLAVGKCEQAFSDVVDDQVLFGQAEHIRFARRIGFDHPAFVIFVERAGAFDVNAVDNRAPGQRLTNRFTGIDVAFTLHLCIMKERFADRQADREARTGELDP